MMKEIQRKKKVLIDLTNYGSLTAGFGQIAANYATAFSSMPVDDLHFVYLLRQKYMQEFGPNVTSVPVRRINKFFPFTLPKVQGRCMACGESTAQAVAYCRWYKVYLYYTRL